MGEKRKTQMNKLGKKRQMGDKWQTGFQSSGNNVGKEVGDKGKDLKNKWETSETKSQVKTRRCKTIWETSGEKLQKW